MHVISNSNRKGNYKLDGNISGITLHSKNKDNIKTVIICDNDFKSKYIINKFNKKLESIIKLINKSYMDDSEEDGNILDLISKLKSIVINKYKIIVKDKEYKDMMKKLIIIENEYKKRIYYKEYYSNNISSKSL